MAVKDEADGMTPQCINSDDRALSVLPGARTMRPSRTMFLLTLIVAGSIPIVGAAQSDQVVPTIDSLVWRQARPGLETAVVEGDPSAVGVPYALGLRLEDGEWIPPHWHGLEKRIVVIEGAVLLGFGDAIEDASVRVLEPGVVAVVPAKAHHYEGARGRTTLVLLGIGPLTTTLVKPE